MARGSKTTLNELMGSRGEDFHKEGVTFDDLPDLLGELMPKLEFHTLGRIRLQAALRQRFGDNYKNMPGIQGLLRKFDQEADIERRHYELRKKLGRK
jgi:hypothetical protein